MPLRERRRLPGSLAGTNGAMVAVMLAIGTASIIWGERLQVNDGLGWDGVRFADWVANFPQRVLVDHVPAYYTQRFLPSAVLHYVLKALAVTPTAPHVVLAFALYNLVLVGVAAFLWAKIAERMDLTPAGRWVGFSLLFLNFAMLKHAAYVPVLTDTTAFCLGLLSFYCYLTNNGIGLLGAMLAGSFTWPIFLPMALLLYVFPCRPADPAVRPPPRRLPVLVASAAVAVAASCIGFLFTHDFALRVDAARRTVRIDFALLFPSLAAVWLYLFFSIKAATTDGALFDLQRLRRAIDPRRAAVAVVLVAAVALVAASLANGERINFTLAGFAAFVSLASLTEPFIFLLAHAVYYGPAILVLMWLWRPFCDSLKEFGIGLRLFVILTLVLALNPQSRHLMNAAPVFIVLAARLLDRRGISRGSAVAWTLLCLVCSKIWLRLNVGPQVDDGTVEVLWRFPLQRLFMNAGNWMSHDMYLLQGAGACVAALVVLALLRPQGARTAPVAANSTPVSGPCAL